MSSHKISFFVYYEDTDAAGVVYHANYLKFAERARTEWLRQLGYEQSELLSNENVIFPVFKLQIDFLAPAKLDDKLVIQTTLIELKKVQMTLKQQIFCDHNHIASLKVQVACCNANKKPTRWPKSLFETLQKQLRLD